MRTATLATMTALAALFLMSPEVSTVDVNAANGKIKPRLHVKPKVRVKVNTKRLMRKKRTKSQVATAPKKQRVSKPKVRFKVLPPASFSLNPAFDAAVSDLGRELAGIDTGSTDLAEIASLDLAAAALAFPVKGLGNDNAEPNNPLGGLKPPGRGDSRWSPNDVLPGGNERPDTGHLGVDVEGAKSGTANGGSGRRRIVAHTDTGWDHDQDARYAHRTITDDYSDGTSRSHHWRVDNAAPGDPMYNWWEYTDKHGRVTERFGNPPPGVPLVKNGRPAPTVNDAPSDGKPTADKPDAGKPGKDPVKRYDPDYAGGGETIPVNCGSVACNEARKGKGGLDPTAHPTAQVLPSDPSEPQTGTVAQAPRTGADWRRKATTNPGSEPHDNGSGRRRNNFGDQILVFDEADGPKPPVAGN